MLRWAIFAGRAADGQAVERAERVLGADHEQTLLAANNLGALRVEQGRLGEAEPLLQRALAGRERVLGQDHDETVDSLSVLATLYRAQQRYDEAEPLMRRALAARERVSGADFPGTIYAMNNLGNLLMLRGAYPEAEALFVRAEQGARKLGPDHPHLNDARDGRAWAMMLTGRIGEAEPIAREALAARERVQGADHPATLRALSLMANIYLFTDRPQLAEPLLLRSMVEGRAAAGPGASGYADGD
jgi:tetratricopeptide (TPR) repeat protein